MVKALQKRFVIVAMAAITGLILLLLGAINAANLMLISQRMDRTLELLCSADGDPGNLPPTDNRKPPLFTVFHLGCSWPAHMAVSFTFTSCLLALPPSW